MWDFIPWQFGHCATKELQRATRARATKEFMIIFADAARSRDAWYGKPPIVSEDCPLETFTSENAPRIKSSGKKTDRALRDSKPVSTIEIHTQFLSPKLLDYRA